MVYLKDFFSAVVIKTNYTLRLAKKTTSGLSFLSNRAKKNMCVYLSVFLTDCLSVIAITADQVKKNQRAMYLKNPQ